MFYNVCKDLLSEYNKKKKNLNSTTFLKLLLKSFYFVQRINPLRQIPAELHSTKKCDKFASYFKYKISSGCDLSSSHTLSNFALIHCSELQEVV